MTRADWERNVLTAATSEDGLLSVALLDTRPDDPEYCTYACTPELIEVAMMQYTDDLVGSFNQMTVPILSRLIAIRRMLE